MDSLKWPNESEGVCIQYCIVFNNDFISEISFYVLFVERILIGFKQNRLGIGLVSWCLRFPMTISHLLNILFIGPQLLIIVLFILSDKQIWLLDYS